MFDPKGKSTGISYTATVTLLSVAAIFVPAILFASRPIGNDMLGIASASGLAFLGFAWMSWRRSSRMSIPTITGGRTERR